MTIALTPRGFRYPDFLEGYSNATLGFGTSTTLDAAAEECAHIGYVYWEDGGSHTISAAGGGSISFTTGTPITWAGGDTLEIGLQDVSTSAGQFAQPDGTFDVSRVWTQGVDALAASTWTTIAMTGGSGTKTLATGDAIAVVWDMLTRTTSSVLITNFLVPDALQRSFPGINEFIGAAWTKTGNVVYGWPKVMLTADDGAIGILNPSIPFSAVAAQESFQDSTNPDERGLLFQVPWDCQAVGWWGDIGFNHVTNSTATLKLYSSPTSSPSFITSRALIPAHTGRAGTAGFIAGGSWSSPISLTRNTDYGLTVLATGSDTVGLTHFTLPTADLRKVMPGGTSLAKITRDGSSGPFSSSSTTIMYRMGLVINGFHDTSSAAGGGSKMIGG